VEQIVEQFNKEISTFLHQTYYIDKYIINTTINNNVHVEEEKVLVSSDKIKPIKVTIDKSYWYFHYLTYNKENKIGCKFNPDIVNTFNTSFSFTSYFSNYYNNDDGTIHYIKIRKTF
jgi:hypothetical protein